MAFSLKSLLKGRKKGAVDQISDDDDPFMKSGPEEIPEIEMEKMERAQAEADAEAREKANPSLSRFLPKSLRGLVRGKGKGKKKKKKAPVPADPFDNPELMALIASEVAAIPMPDAVAEADPEPEVVPRHVEEEPTPAPAAPADDDEEMLDEETQPVEEELPAFMSKPERDYEGMPDFAMPEDAKYDTHYEGDGDGFPGQFPLGGLDEDDPLDGTSSQSPLRKGLMAAAAVLLIAAVGGGAWWLMGHGGADGPDGQQVADGTTPSKGWGKKGKVEVPVALPGDRVSMTLSPPPKLAEETASEETAKSLSRRPWLNAGETPLGPDGKPVAGDQDTAQAAKGPDDHAGGAIAPLADTSAQAAGKEPAAEAAPAETKTAEASAPPPADEDTAAESAKATPVNGASSPDGLGDGTQSQMTLAALPPLKDPLLPTPSDTRKTPSFDKLPRPAEPAAALSAAPVGGLFQNTPLGPLPVRGADGQAAWKAYARPFTAPAQTPRIALVVVGLGLDANATAAAITALPPDVTLSFSPYAPNVGEQMAEARKGGHEVLLDLPMEPSNFPASDPGPMAMLTMLTPVDNVGRLEMLLGKGTGYTGVINRLGAKFTDSPDAMRPVLEALGKRGLLYVNVQPKAAGVAANVDVSVPMAEAVTTVDQRPFRAAVEGRLNYLVTAAKARGRVVGVVSATPLAFDRIIAWASGLEKEGVVLAPVSAAVSGPAS